jgi:hypothetical protein
MAAFEHPSFHYHAEGHAFSGEITRPLQHKIDALASGALPLEGGQSGATIENYSVGNLLTIKRAYSSFSGSHDKEKNIHNTHATTVVEGMNLFDMVTADRVVARLTSEHDPKNREGHILAYGTQFSNLQVAGCSVEVEFDHDLFEGCKTYAELHKRLPAMKKAGRLAEESHGVILCTLVKNLSVDCPGVSVRGHVITVPHFGKIYVGEVLAEHGYRRLSTLRFELGSPTGGGLNGPGTGTNGEPWP